MMSTLIISAPPMAAAFFQGTLGQFSPYSAMGALERGGAPAGPNGGIIPHRVPNDTNTSSVSPNAAYQSMMRPEDAPSTDGTGTRGLASR